MEKRKIKPCIYTTEDILEQIFFWNDNPDNGTELKIWYDFIIRTRPYVRILLREDSNFGTLENKLLLIQTAYDLSIDLISKDDINTLLQILSFSSELQNELDSRAIMLFDISPDDAKQISDMYGIICHSIKKSSRDCPLFLKNRDVWCQKDDSNESWNKIMRYEVLRPANSLIFIDRYLFSDDLSASIKDGIKDGIKNIRYFLERILPKNLVGEYHFLLVFDDSTIHDNHDRQKFADVTTDINRLVEETINRPYRIIVELLSIAKNEYDPYGKVVRCANHCKTHNRRVMSNYYILRAEHSLKVQRNSKILYSQSLSLDWYASKGFIRNLDSDYMGRYLDASIEDIRKIIHDFKGQENVLFSQNGEMKPIDYIVNRLVKS